MNCSGAVAPSVEFTSETLYIVVCYSVVFLFAFVGNVVMFLILFRNQCQKRRRVHSLLLHMTVAHLLVTMVYMPKEIIHNITVGWWGGDVLCRICKFFDVFGVALSTGILMCLSLDRFYSILFPLYVINAKRSVMRMLTVAWCVSILTSLPQIYIFRSAQHPCFDWYTQCVSADVIGQISSRVTFWFSVLNIIQVYLLPLIVIIICYGSILISISLKTRGTSFARAGDTAPATSAKSNAADVAFTAAALSTSAFLSQNRLKSSSATGIASRLSLMSERGATPSPPTAAAYAHHKTFIPKSNSISVSGVVSSNGAASGGGAAAAAAGGASDALLRRTGGENSFQRAKNRTLKMTVVLVLAFLLCWTPYTVAMFIHFFYASQRMIPPLLRKFLYAFAVFNSAISPYLYGYFSFDIWEELRLLLLYLCSPSGCCLGPCVCRRFGKHSVDVIANRRHAIRVRTTGELSSSTLLPPTTTVSGYSIRYKQSLKPHHNPQIQPQDKPTLASFRGAKALSLDDTNSNVCFRNDAAVAGGATPPSISTAAVVAATSQMYGSCASNTSVAASSVQRSGAQIVIANGGASLLSNNNNNNTNSKNNDDNEHRATPPSIYRTARRDESRQPLLQSAGGPGDGRTISEDSDSEEPTDFKIICRHKTQI